MAVFQELKFRSKQVILPVVGACVLGYFSYHAVQGDRGFLAFGRLTQEVQEAKHTLAMLQAERRQIEQRTARLRGDSLDLDLLEERVRASFNHAYSDELIIFLPEKSD